MAYIEYIESVADRQKYLRRLVPGVTTQLFAMIVPKENKFAVGGGVYLVARLNLEGC